MMKRWILTFIFLLCVQCCLVCSCSGDKERYLFNIEKALDAGKFHEIFKPLEYPNRKEVKELFLRIYENEKAHPDFIQCLNAQDSFFYAYQVIAKELYRKLYGFPREDFEFLRFPTQNLLKTKEEFFSRYPSFIFSKEELAKEFKTTPDKLDETIKTFELCDEEEYLKISKHEDETSIRLAKEFNTTPDKLDETIRALNTSDDEEYLKITNEEKADERFDEGELNNSELDDYAETASRFQINDTISEISREIVSVNFTMETYRPLDSAMCAFLSSHSISLASISQDEAEYKQKLIQILYELFDSIPLPRKKLESCIEKLIEKAPRTNCGIINQIFLPKENVSHFLYLSFGGGFLHSIYDSNFEDSYGEFQANRQEESFRTFRNFQARIIAGSLFEDPKVKIIRYTLIPEETQRQYELFVRDVIDELLPTHSTL
jgi:hypothetical protein